jgi:MFS superfamily sulfate permease-like transporter
MKIYFLVLALLVMGLVFVAPPLIMAAPVLLVALALFAVPAMLRGLDQGDRSGDGGAVRSGPPPTSDPPR